LNLVNSITLLSHPALLLLTTSGLKAADNPQALIDLASSDARAAASHYLAKLANAIEVSKRLSPAARDRALNALQTR
jgi:hypothetical protein